MILIFLFLLLSYSKASTIEYKTCSGQYVMDIKSLSAVPWPPRTGLRTAFEFDTYLFKETPSLYVNVTLQMSVGFKSWETIMIDKFDLCNESSSCPLQPGQHSFGFHYNIPANAPVGNRWRAVIRFEDKEENQLSCIELDRFKVN